MIDKLKEELKQQMKDELELKQQMKDELEQTNELIKNMQELLNNLVKDKIDK
jgi:hypothetical protein